MQKQNKSKKGWKIIHLSHQRQAKIYIKNPISSSSMAIIYYGQLQSLLDHTRKNIVLKKHLHISPELSQTQNKIMNIKSNHILTPLEIIKFQGENSQFYEIYSYCQHGTLQSYYDTHNKDKFEKIFILNIIHGILTGYEDLKNNNIIHENITAKSVFLKDKKHVMLGDIGIKNINITSPEGEYLIYYRSPERLLQQKQTNTLRNNNSNVTKNINQADFTCDIYSLGILFYELIHATHPYIFHFNVWFAQKKDLKNRSQQYIQYITSNIDLPKMKYQKQIYWNKQQQQFLSVVQSMISIDPPLRPCFKDIITYFRSIYNPSPENQQSFISNTRSYLSKNNISNVSFRDISSELLLNSSSILGNSQNIQFKINRAYINFLNKKDILSFIGPVGSSFDYPILSVRNSKSNIQQDIADLKNVLMNLIEKQQSLDVEFSQQELLTQMTSAISLSFNILQQIQKVKSKQEIKLVKYLFDCHYIFFTKQQLRIKQNYKQFQNDEEKQIELIKQINNLCQQYFIVPKKLVV